MLLTIFRGIVESSEFVKALEKHKFGYVDGGFRISIEIPSKMKERIDAIGFENDGIIFVACKTYKIELAQDAFSMIGYKSFNSLEFDHSAYVNWFNTSSQLIECEYEFENIERKATAMDLRRLGTFMQRIQKAEIYSATFTLSPYKVIITARKEGRISISPDVDDKALLDILRSILSLAGLANVQPGTTTR